jgi:quinolinate synthase
MQNTKNRIEKLKKERDAVILAHYYVPKDVQEIADYVGDSYYLSKIATRITQKVIVFCGVYFMGESAKILNPDKVVLMVDPMADCPMAHMADIMEIKKIRREIEDVAVVCYINSTAEIKANSDVCVTSSNAYKVIKKLPNKNIYFIPDANLGRHISKLIPEKNFIFNQGYCHVHTKITVNDVLDKKHKYPLAKVAAHPECIQEVLQLADYVGSTSGIIDYVEKSDALDFIICTETGVFYDLEKKIKDKNLHPAIDEQICPDMKKNTLQKLLYTLENLDNEVKVDELMLNNALKPLDKMLKLASEK